MFSPSWTSLPPPTPSHPSRLSQSTGLSSLHQQRSKFPLATYFTYSNVYVSMLLFQFVLATYILWSVFTFYKNSQFPNNDIHAWIQPKEGERWWSKVPACRLGARETVPGHNAGWGVSPIPLSPSPSEQPFHGRDLDSHANHSPEALHTLRGTEQALSPISDSTRIVGQIHECMRVCQPRKQSEGKGAQSPHEPQTGSPAPPTLWEERTPLHRLPKTNVIQSKFCSSVGCLDEGCHWYPVPTMMNFAEWSRISCMLSSPSHRIVGFQSCPQSPESHITPVITVQEQRVRKE